MPSPISSSLDAASDGRALRRRDNAKRLFDTAMKLAKQSGYQSMTVDAICKEAGIGRATFFRIYETKAGLLREFNRRLAIDIEARIAACDGGVIEKLEIVTDGIAQAWQQGGAVLASMVMDYISNLSDGILHSIHQEIFEQVIAIVEEGIESEVLRQVMPAQELASLILHQINITVTAAGFAGQGDFQSAARGALDCILNGAAKKSE